MHVLRVFSGMLLSFLVLIDLPVAVGGSKMTITSAPFGTVQGRSVLKYHLDNGRGLRASIITYGGIIVSLEAPDRKGSLADIVLGFDTLEAYVKSNPYFGSLVGRYGNRIARGQFTLAGKTYILAKNNGENHLHGGVIGLDKVIWAAEPLQEANAVGLKLKHTSKDGDEGYPGRLELTVIYRLTSDNALDITYEAKTDKVTPVNLTHHSYFNLAGQGDILGHQLTLDAPYYTPVDAGLIPSGEILSVAGTPFDFTAPHAIGSRIAEQHQQLLFGKGYDHNFVLSHPAGQLGRAASVVDPGSGRKMEVFTTEPGLQFYSGNFLDGSLTGKAGRKYQQRSGFCLETQHFPDSPNKPHFPSTILNPGQVYHQHTRYVFSAQ